jgi:hypothetical protein
MLPICYQNLTERLGLNPWGEQPKFFNYVSRRL